MSTDSPNGMASEEFDDSQHITCKMCGEQNDPVGTECVRCGEPYAGISSLKKRHKQSELLRKNPLGFWRDQNILVMHKQAEFPDICIKTNQPAEGNRYAWQTFWLEGRRSISLGLTAEYQSVRMAKKNIGFTIFVICLAISLSFPFVMHQVGFRSDGVAFATFFISLLVGVAGAIYSSIYAELVQELKTTDECIFIKGVHQGFINRYPRWEGE